MTRPSRYLRSAIVTVCVLAGLPNFGAAAQEGGTHTLPAIVGKTGTIVAQAPASVRTPAPGLLAHESVVYDQGPSTGANAGCWANQTGGQNFADRVTFTRPTYVTVMSIWTCIASGGTVHLKILADNGSGAPGTVLYSEDKTPDNWVADGPGYKVTVTLSTEFFAQAGVQYWYGISGNGFELGQLSVVAPDDSTMAQFAGASFQFMTETFVGDQMFELVGYESSPGTLILEKLTDPNDPNSVFDFDTSALDPNTPVTSLSNGDTSTFPGLLGTYRVDEIPVPGWELNLVECSVDTGNNDTVWDPNDPTGVDIVVNSSQTVTCTFTNRRLDAALTVTKTADPLQVSGGENVTWVVTIDNAGPDEAQAVTVTDALPPGASLLSATPSQGTCQEVMGVLTCDLGTIAASGSATVTIVAETLAVSELVNSVDVSANSGNATGQATAPAIAVAATDVPALDEIALLIMTLVLAMAGFVALRR